MFHCNGWCFTWAVTAVGGTHICLRRVESGRIWDMLESEAVTHYNGAPTVQIGVVNDPKAKKLERSVTVTVAGAPPSPTLLGKLKELNFRPVHVYGLTETYGPHTVCEWHSEWDALPAEEQARLAARQGQGYAVFDLVRVVDDNMRDVPRDGRVLPRGMVSLGGYRRLASRRLHRAARPEEGHHHLGRREYLDHRGGAGGGQASRCPRVRGGGHH